MKGVRVVEARAFYSDEIPFWLAFGNQQPAKVPMAFYWVKVEDENGNTATGFSQDFESRWFDKEAKTQEEFSSAFRQTMGYAVDTLTHEYHNRMLHPLKIGHERGDILRARAVEHGTTRLAGQAVMALEERALFDALGNLHGQNSMNFLSPVDLGFDLGEIDPVLQGFDLTDIVNEERRPHLFIRHTIGHTDVLYEDQVTSEMRRNGPPGVPISLEGHIQQNSYAHFKIKITKNRRQSINRLKEIAIILDQQAPPDYMATLDGNEDFASLSSVEAFMDLFYKESRKDNALAKLWDRVAYVEQPFRRFALDKLTDADKETIARIQHLTRGKPLLIDESGFETDSYTTAIAAGITRTSLKLCKGVLHSLVDVARAYVANGYSLKGIHQYSGEDLTVAGPGNFAQALDFFSRIIGIEQIELNGHTKTLAGTPYSRAEILSILDQMPNTYVRHRHHLLQTPASNTFSTADVNAPGFGNGGVLFDPSYERKRHPITYN